MANISTTSLWIQYYRPKSESKLRLFCFPYAGGSASVFRAWSDLLPPEIEICPVQLPGRENRLQESLFTHMVPLVGALGQALLPYLDRPYAFFGHSMGALLCFELTRYLGQMNVPDPLRLFVSGHRAPQLTDHSQPIHDLPESAFLEELRRLKGTPDEVLQNTELLNLVIPALRADFAVCETYRYAPAKPLLCPISALGGLEDEEVPRGDLAAWREQTRGSFTLRFFVGNHFFIHTARNSLLHAVLRDLFVYLR